MRAREICTGSRPANIFFTCFSANPGFCPAGRTDAPGRQACFCHRAQELRGKRKNVGEQVTEPSGSHVQDTTWCRGVTRVRFTTRSNQVHGQTERASLTWVVVRRGFVQHDGVLGVRAHQGQNQSCTDII